MKVQKLLCTLVLIILASISISSLTYAEKTNAYSNYSLEYYGAKYDFLKKVKCYTDATKYAGEGKVYELIKGEGPQYIIIAPNGYTYEVEKNIYPENGYKYKTFGVGIYFNI